MSKELDEALEDLEQLAEMADNCWVSCDVHKWKNTIKQALIKAREQEKENKFLSDTIATVNKQYTDLMLEYQEQKRVLEILKPYLRLFDNYLQARVNFYDDYWLIVKEITDEKELEVLKKILE